ncbi:discoidin domain-containing protein [Paenibacillus sp. HWE-109]|uniref:discoidin domain-containing protein n=1 Tax=Paenibacillus sp. HWE-109 TaxID=1306526 RepID=UPI001EDF0C2E|nr:discoidin domain-containing protein [Paenibacillus sp. HWE-109]UKS28681.1 discoidin domain-containing protein [Paenibacillus sp. HWE-109]
MWHKIIIACVTMTLVFSGLWVPAMPKVAAATGAPMVVSSLEGSVTQEEINSFKQYILSSSVNLPVNNYGNDFVYGPSGQNVEAMGYMYEISGDRSILDQMVKFSELMLSARNNPDTGRVLWNGNRELSWPNKKVGETNSDGLVIDGYSGSENGDVIGHIAYSAKLILQNKSLWNQIVPYGDGALYGETYLQRAKKYIAELDRTMDTYMIPNFVKPDTFRQYWPNDPRWSSTGSAAPNSAIPWNQQMMINNGFMRLAECHELLADDQPRVDLYDKIVKASIEWFTASLEPYQVAGHDVYKWWYVADYFGKVEDADGVHAANDIMGMTRAYDRGKYGVTQETLIKLSNTIRYVISTGTGNFYCKVDGLPTSCTLTNLWSEYLHIAPYNPDPAVYRLLANPYYMSTVLTSPIYFARMMWVKEHTSWTRNVDADLSPAWEAESYSSRSGAFTRQACEVCSKGAYMQSPEDSVSKLNYRLSVAHGGNLYVHILGSSSGAGGGSLKLYVDAGPEVNATTSSSGWGWTTASQALTLADGPHQLTITSQGNGAQLDKIVLSKSPTPPIDALLPKLTDIRINGVSLANFAPSTYSYTAALPLGTKVIPIISATSLHNVEITQAQQVFGTAIITVKDRQDPYLQAKYEVQMTGFPIYGDIPDRFMTFPIQSVTASAGYHASFPPANAIDGDLNTRYAAKGITHWIQFDLGANKPIRSAVISFLKGDVDRYTFDLQVSEDGLVWTSVYSGKSSGKTAGLEIFPFEQVNARYVKYNGKGNSKDTWNNINEIYIGGVVEDVAAPVTTDDGQSGWHADNQIIHLSAVDSGSGVAHTYYSLNGGPETEGTVVNIDQEGSNELAYYSVDTAGNREFKKSTLIQVDKSGPTITPTVSMAVYVTDTVSFNFGIADTFSGVNDKVIKLDGKLVASPYVIEPMSLTLGNHLVSVIAADRVGNQSEQQFVLKVSMDIDHLDEALLYAKQKGWIKSDLVYKGLTALVGVIQKAPKEHVNQGLQALEVLVKAQKGHLIDEATASKLLEWIAALKRS